MIQVGIQDNIRLVEALINDKGTLVISALQDSGGSTSLLASLSSSSTQTQDNEQDFIMWDIKEDDRLTSDAEKMKDVLNKLKGYRAQLNHFLEQYMLSANIHWDPIANLGLADDAALQTGLLDSVKRPLVVAGIYNNYSQQFVTQISKHIGPNSGLYRMKLQRTSKDKNFSTIPKFTPFIEPMSVPKTQSQLKWTPYDLGKRKGDPDKGPYSGLNVSDPTQVEGAGSTAAKADPKEAADVAHLFGG